MLHPIHDVYQGHVHEAGAIPPLYQMVGSKKYHAWSLYNNIIPHYSVRDKESSQVLLSMYIGLFTIDLHSNNYLREHHLMQALWGWSLDDKLY